MINGRRIIDAFPFFNELDVLEVRLNELKDVVDTTVISECMETYGGDRKDLLFQRRKHEERFRDFKIVNQVVPRLEPPIRHTLKQNTPGVSAQSIRVVGRQREANARDLIWSALEQLNLKDTDLISFGDCDEIPSAEGMRKAVELIDAGAVAVRFKQFSFYYNVNCLVDYGRDVCSRARLVTYAEAKRLKGKMYEVRMLGNKDPKFPAVEYGGWHFSYFSGDLTKIYEKVAALNPFLKEYELYGKPRLYQDILNRKDLHHRNTTFSELAETFGDGHGTPMPKFLLDKLTTTFKHFTEAGLREKYEGTKAPR
jgi:beta-1,4-mannosyl-glycoprotein beta-1,4-N-acetylglucosaminyltransferase